MSKVTQRPTGNCVYTDFTDFIHICNSDSMHGPVASLHSLTTHMLLPRPYMSAQISHVSLQKIYFKYPSLLMKNQWTKLEQEDLNSLDHHPS